MDDDLDVAEQELNEESMQMRRREVGSVRRHSTRVSMIIPSDFVWMDDRFLFQTQSTSTSISLTHSGDFFSED